MWSFWIGAGTLAAVVAALMSWAAVRAAERAEESGARSTELYRRQLAEVDELAGRGLIGAEETRAARAEAGRRLLAEAERPVPVWRVGARSRRALLVGAGLSVVAAVLLYRVAGRPGAPDQPFRARLERWRAADPARLDPDQLVAVLSDATRRRPDDPLGQELLGRAQLAAGDAASAVQPFTRATRFAPNSAAAQAELGEALTLAADGVVTREAEAAFNRARSLEPENTAARYFIGRADLARGDREGALALWRPLALALPLEDPRRRALTREIAQTEGAPAVTPGGTRLDAGTAAMARGMVAGLAARLKTHPDDPDGWARLVTSYGVLGDRAAQADALTRARRLFAGRPDALAKIDAATRGRPPG